MLFELPTADEIDELAVTSPHVEVRRMDIDRSAQRADLNYAPCKGQVMMVVRGPNGTALVRRSPSAGWELPSGRIGSTEDIGKSVKRVARESGISARSVELHGIYDVVWHYSDISVKRLHLAYEVLTDDEGPDITAQQGPEVRFFQEVPPEIMADEVSRTTVSDCSQK